MMPMLVDFSTEIKIPSYVDCWASWLE